MTVKSSFGKGTDPSAEVTCVAKSAVDKKYWRPGHRLRSKLPLLLGYSHHTGDPPWLHSRNPTKRPLQPLTMSMSSAAKMTLYPILLPIIVHQPQIDLSHRHRSKPDENFAQRDTTDGFVLLPAIRRCSFLQGRPRRAG